MTFGIVEFLLLVLVIGPAIMLAPIAVNAIIQRRDDARFYRNEYLRLRRQNIEYDAYFYRAEYLRLRNENMQLSREIAKLQPPF